MSSFYPATVGRVSTAQATNRLLYQVNSDQSAIQKLQIQLSTGRRIERPSQDPAAAIRALAAQRSLEFKDQVINNLKSANTILSASESTLSQAQSILNDIRGVAVESSGNTLSDAERTANASQIGDAIKKLVEIGNSRFRDQYIFGGDNVTQPPLRYVAGAVQYSGTSGELNTITDIGATLAANVTADETFGTRSDRIVGSTDLDPAIRGTTPLADLNYGQGVRRGSIELFDGTNKVEIDLTNAHTVQDVVDAIQSKQVGSRDILVTINQNGLSVDYADGLGGLMRISEVGSSLTAGDLGIRTSGNVNISPVVGTDLNSRATNQTRLDQLFGGAGVANGSAFIIRQNNQDYVINTAGLTTVEDLVNTIKSSGARVTAGLDATGTHFMIQSNESGSTLTIGERGGNLATLLGVRSFDTTTSVSRLNFGQGIYQSDSGNDLVIRRTDGTDLSINLDGVQTVGDVMNRINSHVDNFNPLTKVTVSLAAVGNGLVFSSPAGTEPLQIINPGGSQAGIGLGLIPRGASSVAGINVGTENVISGIDVSGFEVEGAFTTLLRLKNAVATGSTTDMERLVSSLDVDIQRLSMSRSVVGARQQNIESIQSRTEDQQIQLKEVESNEIDTDLASVISEMTGRQAALEASMKLMGTSSRMSLFDFL